MRLAVIKVDVCDSPESVTLVIWFRLRVVIVCLCFVEFVLGLDTADEVLAHDFTEVGTPKSPSAVCDRGQRSVRATSETSQSNAYRILSSQSSH